MTNGILCTTDFSVSSREALKCSISLAKKLDSPLTILYTFRILKQNGEGIAMKRKMEEEASVKFKALEQELLTDKGVAYDFKSEVGFVEDRIEEHTRNNAVSFLVMDKDMGTNKEILEELLDNLRIPLVLVP